MVRKEFVRLKPHAALPTAIQGGGAARFAALVLAATFVLSLVALGQNQVSPAETARAAQSSASAGAATVTLKAELRIGANPMAAPITLREAVALALEKNPMRKAALADQKIAAADLREAKAALFPRLTFSESATRGNDPVYAFGTRLRQGSFSAADFALNRLNSPLPLGNFVTRLSAQWNLFNAPDWLNVRRAERMKEAAAQQLQRNDQQIVMRVVNAYNALLLAIKQQQLAEQQVRTAESILHASQARYDSGLVVESDFLAAQVNQAVRRQQLIRSANAVSLAQAQLNTAMGVPVEISFRPKEVLKESGLELIELADAEQRALASRPDLKQLEAQQLAVDAGARAARSAFAPRVGAFAAWEQNNPALFAGGNNNWISGVQVEFDLFTGGQKTAQLQRARAMQEKTAALRQSAADQVRLEVRKAWYDADAARQQVAVTHAAIAQSEESLRITQTRYQAGLTTITDLLRAEESRARTQTDYWQAVYGFQTALANLELAMGTLSEASAVTQ